MKLMIVDDHLEMRRLICEVLGRFAAEICECIDGQDAVSRCENFRPDIVIMDLHMPNMDGLEATPKILAQHPSAIVLMLSQSDGTGLREAAARAGASGYLSKDDFSGLVQLLEQSRTHHK